MTSALGPSWLDASQLIENFGLLGIMAIVFAECGLLVGFFLPGDTLLFTAGVLVQRGTFNQPLWWVILPGMILGTIVGILPGFSAQNTLIILLPLTLYLR